jgi:hypothetical protein
VFFLPTITGDVLLITLRDWRTFVGVVCSGCINVGSILLILGRAPGVLFRVCRRCMRAVVIKFRFAIGSRVCMIAGASEIRGIVLMGASSLGGRSMTSLLATLCSSPFGGVRMAFIALARLLIRRRPLVVPAAVSVVVVISSVSALRCAFGLRLGTWQCCGNSSADPEMRYALVSGTKYKLHL